MIRTTDPFNENSFVFEYARSEPPSDYPIINTLRIFYPALPPADLTKAELLRDLPIGLEFVDIPDKPHNTSRKHGIGSGKPSSYHSQCRRTFTPGLSLQPCGNRTFSPPSKTTGARYLHPLLVSQGIPLPWQLQSEGRLFTSRSERHSRMGTSLHPRKPAPLSAR